MVVLTVVSVKALTPALPGSPTQMITLAARCINEARQGGISRQTCSIVVPEPVETDPGDLDPWPGGIRQVSREAAPYIESLLKVAFPGSTVRSTTLDVESGVTQYVAEGDIAADDACLLAFADTTNIDLVQQLDDACGDRLLILLNPQFSTVNDFTFFSRGKAKVLLGEGTIYDRFKYAFCLQEIGVRSEDVQLVFNHGVGWAAYASVGASYSGQNLVDAGEALALHDEPEWTKPTYAWLEKQLNMKVPDPIYIRKLKDATTGKGPLSK